MKRGFEVLRDKTLNRSITFARRDRDRLGLRGLLPHRVDTDKQMVQRVMDNLQRLPRDIDRYMLLSSVQDIEDLGLLTPESVERTLELLQTQFDYIVLDSGHMLDDTTVAALRVAPTLLLVSTLTLPVMRATKRWLDIFSRLDVPADNIKLVVNRHKSKNREISLHDFEDTLKTKAFWLVPNDYLVTLKAINTGRCARSFWSAASADTKPR